MPTSVLPSVSMQLGTGLTTIYTAPTGQGNLIARISCIWICNTDSAVRTCTLRFGTSALTIANSIAENWPCPASTSFCVIGSTDPILNLGPGQILQGLSDVASKITVSCSIELFI